MSELYRLVGALERSLDYHLNRQTILASNLANVDTPGFRPLELLRAEEGSPGRPLRMTASAQGHIPFGEASQNEEFVQVEERVTPVGLDGNSVDLEWEMSKVAANEYRFEAVSKMVTRQLGLLKYVSNGG